MLPGQKPLAGRPAPDRVGLIACLTEAPGEDGQGLEDLDDVACLEVRADLVGDIDPDWLRQYFAGALLYTLRSREEGGRFEGSREERVVRLSKAAGRFDYVDLEARIDLTEEVLGLVPAEARVLSWHGAVKPLSVLRRRFAEMAQVPGCLYKLVPACGQSGEEAAPLLLLRELRRDDVIAFSTGSGGTWTRLVAPRLGASVIYAAFGPKPAAPGQLGLDRLRADFGLPALPEVGSIFGIIGNPVAHSLSPRLHNGAYRELGLTAIYLPFHVESFGGFWLEIVEGDVFKGVDLELRGFSVTAPHKAATLAVAVASSPLAKKIESANTLIRGEDGWAAVTTDPQGVVGPLEARGFDLSRARSAVVGCGGAGRAAAAGLKNSGAEVVVVNRSEEPGRSLSRRLGVPFVPLDEFDPSRFQVVVNATSLGHHDEDAMPFRPRQLADGAAVVDMVYRSGDTRLIEQTRKLGHRAICGREVLLHQALGQFERMTDHQLPFDLGVEILGLDSSATPLPTSSAAATGDSR